MTEYALDILRNHYVAFSFIAIAALYLFARVFFNSILQPRKIKLRTHKIPEERNYYDLDYELHGFHKNPNDFKQYLLDALRTIIKGGECNLSSLGALYIGKYFPGEIRVSEDGKYYMLSRTALDSFYKELLAKELKELIREINSLERCLIDKNSDKIVLDAQDLFYRIRNGLIDVKEERPLLHFSKAENMLVSNVEHKYISYDDRISYTEYIRESMKEENSIEIIESENVKVIIKDDDVEVIRKKEREKSSKTGSDVGEQLRMLQEKVLEIYDKTQVDTSKPIASPQDSNEADANHIIQEMVSAQNSKNNLSGNSKSKQKSKRDTLVSQSKTGKKLASSKIDAILFEGLEKKKNTTNNVAKRNGKKETSQKSIKSGDTFAKRVAHLLIELNKECLAFPHRGKIIVDAKTLLDKTGVTYDNIPEGLKKLSEIANKEGCPRLIFSLDYVPVEARIKSDCGDIRSSFIHVIPPEDIASKLSNTAKSIDYF